MKPSGTKSTLENIIIGIENESLFASTWHYVDNSCGTTRQVPDHVYDNDEDMDCNICGAMKYTPGDLDGVPGVSMDDAIYLLFNINFPGSYPVDQPVDFDGNGKVDMDDAIYLLFHVNFPGSYPMD